MEICPNCESKNIQSITQDIGRLFENEPYTVPSVTYYDCPDCHEKIFDREAMSKIEHYSPAYKNELTSK